MALNFKESVINNFKNFKPEFSCYWSRRFIKNRNLLYRSKNIKNCSMVFRSCGTKSPDYEKTKKRILDKSEILMPVFNKDS